MAPLKSSISLLLVAVAVASGNSRLYFYLSFSWVPFSLHLDSGNEIGTETQFNSRLIELNRAIPDWPRWRGRDRGKELATNSLVET